MKKFKELSKDTQKKIFLVMFEESNGFRDCIPSYIYEEMKLNHGLTEKESQSVEIKFGKLFNWKRGGNNE